MVAAPIARRTAWRWCRVDLKAVIEDRFGVVYHERSVSRLLHELDFSQGALNLISQMCKQLACNVICRGDFR